MSRSYTVKGSYAGQSGARPRRGLNNEGILQQDRDGTGVSDEQQDQTAQPAQTNATGDERYQRREAYTVIAPKEDKRQHLLRIQQEEEETVRRRKEEKARTPIKMTPRPVGGPKVSKREFIEHQQKAADKTPTARALEMREKREKWKRQAKEKEEKEIEMKKAAARKQAEKNERKQALQNETVRRHWDEKFSNQSSLSSEQFSSRQDEDFSHEASGWRSFPSQDFSHEASGWRSFPSQDFSHEADGWRDFSPQEQDLEEGDELVELCRRFPDYDPTMLSDLLREQGSVRRVIMMLEG